MYIDTKYKFFYNEITIRNIKEATMDRLRGFEIAKGWEDKGINLPKRSTKNSAGYDVEAAFLNLLQVLNQH